MIELFEDDEADSFESSFLGLAQLPSSNADLTDRIVNQ
jgi:hypothetical protein